MAKLTAKTRASIPTKEFAGPNRSFPIEDKAHARNALSRTHFASNPSAIRAAVHAKYPSIGHPHKNLGGYLHPKKSR
jgi:hypothetical protein